MRRLSKWKRDRMRWKSLRDYPLIIGVSAMSRFSGSIVGLQLFPDPGTMTTGFHLDGTNMPPGFLVVFPPETEGAK